MMADPVAALKRALHSAIAGDATLAGLLGTAGLVDRPARGAALPLIRLTEAKAADWSTGDGEGHEATLALDALDASESAASLDAIAEALSDLLAEDLQPAGFHVVLQTLRLSETREPRERRHRIRRLTLRVLLHSDTI